MNERGLNEEGWKVRRGKRSERVKARDYPHAHHYNYSSMTINPIINTIIITIISTVI
jgi:hypothetical protein